jgi:hypothetical protein
MLEDFLDFFLFGGIRWLDRPATAGRRWCTVISIISRPATAATAGSRWCTVIGRGRGTCIISPSSPATAGSRWCIGIGRGRGTTTSSFRLVAMNNCTHDPHLFYLNDLGILTKKMLDSIDVNFSTEHGMYVIQEQ